MISAFGAVSSCSARSPIGTRYPETQRGFGAALNVDDIAAIGNVDSPPVQFTAAENPFLFPRGLLTTLARRWRCGNSSRSSTGSCPVDVSYAQESPNSDVTAVDRARWFLVHSKPRQEKKLAEQLRSLMLPHYLPVTKCTAITRGRARITRAPQFPGYLFLWANTTQRRSALETNRIVATHQVDDQALLSEQLWDLADLIEKGVPLRVEERLQAGQHVRVKAGVLKDKQGTIIKRGGKTRLFVFVNELLGGVSLEIEQHLLEPY